MFSFFKKNTSKDKNKRKPKGKWPTKPPKHEDDRHFLLNEFEGMGVIQFLTIDKPLKKIDLWFVILMENGYGERYCNVLKNGILIYDSSLIRNTDAWKQHISPWLQNETDFLPKQSALMSAEIAQKIIELEKQFKSD